MILYPVSTVGRRNIEPIQCYAPGGLPYQFEATDTLTGAVYLAGTGQAGSLIFSPTVVWYTAPDSNGDATQTGYGQGQVSAQCTLAQMAMLVDSQRYILAVCRAPSGSPSNTDPVAFLYLLGKAPWNPL